MGLAGDLRALHRRRGARPVFLAVSFALDGLGHVGAARRAAARRPRLVAGAAAAGDLGSRRPAPGDAASCRRPGSSPSPRRCACSASPGRWRSRPCMRPATPAAPSSTIWVWPISPKPPRCSRRSPTRSEGARRGDRGGRSPSSSRCSPSTSRGMRPDGTLLGYAAPAIAVLGDMAARHPVHAGCPRAGRAVAAQLDALARAAGLALVYAGRPARHRLAASRRGGVAALSASHGDAAARGALLHARRRSGGAWPPACPWPRSSRRRVPVWGMSWFFDTENWATRHLELLGGSADRPLARGHGARRHRSSAGAERSTFAVSPPGAHPATSASSSSAIPAKATRRSMRCAISSSRSPATTTCASSSSVRMSSTPTAR